MMKNRKSRDGFALVMVLGFVVLLTVIVLAFFSNALLQRQVADSSANMNRAGLFAEGAVDTIIGDLRQEIVAGSISGGTPVFTNNGVVTKIYYPSAPSNAVPALAGSSGTNGLQNLVKRTSSNSAFYPGAANRAAASSTAGVSANGRSISTARWNAPLFLPKADASNTGDLMPTNSFIAPDWVLVNRGGGNPTAWNNNMRWSSNPNDTNTVVGRYACTIYDEGGVLDVNVAGYPPETDAAISSRKPALAYADLNQIGLTNSVVSALVGWRNNVSAGGSGTFPVYSVSDGGTNYFKSVLGNSSGFLRASGTNATGGQSDRMFVGRQQLIKFFDSLALKGIDTKANLQNALQYLGTFSRTLDQPSFRPATNRPTVLSLAAGGNYATGGDNVINPAFLEVRVSSTFSRHDGSAAVQGEPLVKKRFPLNLLAWLTYEGPSATASAATKSALLAAGISQSVIDRGTSTNIQNFFGLTWSSGKWTYRSGANSPIKTLSGVAGREPDFFELLKASVCVGSIGKAYASNGAAATTPDGYNQQRDNSPDAQIMQMGANIIDQFDADGYPTVVVFNDGSLFGGRDLEYRGVEDLPYLYRVREGKVMTRDSDPPQSALPQAGGTLVDAGEGAYLLQPEIWNPHAVSASTGPRPTNFRLVAATLDPVSNTPTSFSIGVKWRPDSGSDLVGPTSASATLNAAMTFNVPSTRQDLFREPTLLIKPGVPSGSNLAGPATYTLGPASIFTAAYQYGENGIADNLQYTGIPMGVVPMAFATTIPVGGITSTGPTPAAVSAGIAPTGFLYYQTSGNTSSVPYVTYRLQCETPSGWVTYDEKFASSPTASSFDTPGRWSSGNIPGNTNFAYNYNKTFYRLSNKPWAVCAVGSQAAVMVFDPRASRFGMPICGDNGRTSNALSIPLSSSVRYWMDSRVPWNRFGWAGSPTSSPSVAAGSQNAVMTARPDEFQGAVFSNASGANANGYNTGPTAGGWVPNGSTAIIAPGMSAQNNPNIGAYSNLKRYSIDQQPPANATQYFADPDGVVRRAMSAYVPFSTADPARAPAAGRPSGLPLKPAYTFTAGAASADTSTHEFLSRPVLLNRPFRSVSELGHVFSGTPWRNLDCSTPESGAAALLDVFCVADGAGENAVVAGKVNLNTRQPLVLKAVLAGAYKDELGSALAPDMDSPLAASLSTALVARTQGSTASQGPLANVSDLVGKWLASQSVGASVNGSKSYVGFTSDMTANANDLTSVLDPGNSGTTEQRVARFREAAIRPLAAAGQTRVWNLMIDVIAQTGRYPQTASGLGQFFVEGEQRCWVHLAIDRLTGKVIERQYELVKE